jgi:hypothetical protein
MPIRHRRKATNGGDTDETADTHGCIGIADCLVHRLWWLDFSGSTVEQPATLPSDETKWKHTTERAPELELSRD